MGHYGYEYTYEYPSSFNVSNSVFAAIMSVYLIVLTVILIFTLVSYIFHSIGLYTIAKRMGKNYPWLAFIPFARDYLHGELAERIALKTKTIRNPGIWKLVLPIIYGVATSIYFMLFFAVMGIGAFFNYGYNDSLTGGTILTCMVLLLIGTAAIIVYEAAYKVLCVMIDMQIYERFTSRNMAVAHAVLSVTVPLYEAICLFILRNRKFNPGMEPELTPPPIAVPPVYPVPPTEPEHQTAQEPPVQPAETEEQISPIHSEIQENDPAEKTE